MRKLGILILDIFPYALNDTDTVIQYKRLSRDDNLELAKHSYQFHLTSKLEKISAFSESTPRFCVHYSRLRAIAVAVLDKRLKQLGFGAQDFTIISMQGGDNRSGHVRQGVSRIGRALR